MGKTRSRERLHNFAELALMIHLLCWDYWLLWGQQDLHSRKLVLLYHSLSGHASLSMQQTFLDQVYHIWAVIKSCGAIHSCPWSMAYAASFPRRCVHRKAKSSTSVSWEYMCTPIPLFATSVAWKIMSVSASSCVLTSVFSSHGKFVFTSFHVAVITLVVLHLMSCSER